MFIEPESKQFEKFIVWFIRSIGSFQHMSDIYVTSRFEEKLMRKIPAHHYLPEDLAQVRTEYTHCQQYVYVKLNPV